METRFVIGVAAALCACAPALAQHSDILLDVASGRLRTGTETSMPFGAFEGEFGDPIPGATSEPGFGAPAGTFSAGTVVGLSMRRALRVWNSGGFVPAAGASLSISTTSGTIVTPATDPATCTGPGVALGAANSTGGMHVDPAYILSPGAPDGVYLVELEVWMGMPGDAVSEPFVIAFSQNADPVVFEEAVAWAEERHGLPCAANCDGSTAAPVLNVADFTCFLQKFASGDCGANCDRSTSAPVLNVADFTCFLQRFAAGCQ